MVFCLFFIINLLDKFPPMLYNYLNNGNLCDYMKGKGLWILLKLLHQN